MHDSHRRAHSQSLARARLMLSTRLGWLEGFPVATPEGVEMQGVSGPCARVTVDRELLRRSRRAFTTLTRGELAPLLPHVVDDVARFVARTERVLEALAPAAHRGAWPRELAALPGALPPALAPLASALCWSTGAEPSELRAAARWLRAHEASLAAALARKPDATMLVTLVLAFRGAARGLDMAPVLALLATPASHEVDLRDRRNRVQHVAKMAARLRADKAVELARDDAPARTLAPALHDFVRRLGSLSLSAARRALGLVAQFELTEALGERAAHFAQVARAEATLRRLAAAGTRAPDASLRALNEELALLSRTAPGAAMVADALDAACWFAARPTDSAQLAPLLSSLPASWDAYPVRAHCALYVRACHELLPAAHLRAFLRLLALYLELADGADLGRWLGPLRQGILEPLRPGRASALWDEQDLADCAARADVEQLALVWATLAGGRAELDADALRTAFRLVACATDAAQALALFSALSDRHADCPWLPWGPLVALGADDPARFATLTALVSEHDVDEEGLATLVALFRGAGRLALFAQVLEASPARIAALARQLGRLPAARRAQLRMPPAVDGAVPPAWSARYPIALRPALAQLSQCEDDAETVATRILGGSFPDRARLAQELKSVRARLAKAPPSLRARLEARSEALARRLKEKPAPSPRRLENLTRKVLERAERTVFERWEHALRAQLRAGSLRALGLSDDLTLPDDLSCSLLLTALAELPNDTRRLARALLVRRAGPPPWDFREQPDNAAFLTRLRARGIDVAPWLDPELELVRPDARGRPIVARFARDPLEVLRMGEHFDTCLAPFSFNFFSAVSNAVDVNKRVLYAHDGTRMRGRCLFALTGDGAIVTFHAYAHEDGAGFAAVAGEFARALAARMGTVVLPQGSVPTLMAKRWYDDGARDLAGSFPALAPGAPLHARLLAAAPSEVPRLLEEACAPLGVGPISLPLLLHLEALDQRPELVLALVPAFEASHAPEPHARRRLLVLLVRAGHPARAAQQCCVDDLVRWLHDGRDESELEQIMLVAPSRARMALRRMRARFRRRDGAGHDLAYWNVVILLALGRRAQATRALEKVAAQMSIESAREYRERFARLCAQRDALEPAGGA